jgi:polar amino acid transport system substrate-binding protein
MQTTSWRVYYFLGLLLLIVFCSKVSVAENLAQFRHIDTGLVSPPETVTSVVKLLTDVDFAPYSYKNALGELVGISVDMATIACSEAKIKCQIIAVPFEDLLPAMARGEGDAIISALRTSPNMMRDISLTRPYFVSSAQFITRLGSTLAAPDVKAVAGRRVGFVKGTTHQAFLDKYYGRSALTGFATEIEMFENLRTGGLDVAFADLLHAHFWMQSKSSRACCEPLGAAFIDRALFSRGLSFLVKRDQSMLRENLDYGLDQAQVKGEAAKIFRRYLP